MMFVSPYKVNKDIRDFGFYNIIKGEKFFLLKHIISMRMQRYRYSQREYNLNEDYIFRLETEFNGFHFWFFIFSFDLCGSAAPCEKKNIYLDF